MASDEIDFEHFELIGVIHGPIMDRPDMEAYQDESVVAIGVVPEQHVHCLAEKSRLADTPEDILHSVQRVRRADATMVVRQTEGCPSFVIDVSEDTLSLDALRILTQETIEDEKVDFNPGISPDSLNVIFEHDLPAYTEAFVFDAILEAARSKAPQPQLAVAA